MSERRRPGHGWWCLLALLLTAAAAASAWYARPGPRDSRGPSLQVLPADAAELRRAQLALAGAASPAGDPLLGAPGTALAPPWRDPPLYSSLLAVLAALLPGGLAGDPALRGVAPERLLECAQRLLMASAVLAALGLALALRWQASVHGLARAWWAALLAAGAALAWPWDATVLVRGSSLAPAWFALQLACTSLALRALPARLALGPWALHQERALDPVLGALGAGLCGALLVLSGSQHAGLAAANLLPWIWLSLRRVPGAARAGLLVCLSAAVVLQLGCAASPWQALAPHALLWPSTAWPWIPVCLAGGFAFAASMAREPRPEPWLQAAACCLPLVGLILLPPTLVGWDELAPASAPLPILGCLTVGCTALASWSTPSSATRAWVLGLGAALLAAASGWVRESSAAGVALAFLVGLALLEARRPWVSGTALLAGAVLSWQLLSRAQPWPPNLPAPAALEGAARWLREQTEAPSAWNSTVADPSWWVFCDHPVGEFLACEARRPVLAPWPDAERALAFQLLSGSSAAAERADLLDDLRAQRDPEQLLVTLERHRLRFLVFSADPQADPDSVLQRLARAAAAQDNAVHPRLVCAWSSANLADSTGAPVWIYRVLPSAAPALR